MIFLLGSCKVVTSGTAAGRLACMNLHNHPEGNSGSPRGRTLALHTPEGNMVFVGTNSQLMLSRD